MIISILIIAVCFVAFTNGANANFKGVASLYGSRTTTLRSALWLGTTATFAGSIVAVYIADDLVKKFSAKGLVEDELLLSPTFTSAVALGAALTSFLANRFGFPVSTTHALVGSLVGAGMSGNHQHVYWGALGKNFIYPLVFSPLIAIFFGGIVYWVLRSVRWLPNEKSPMLDLAHFLTAGAASFSRGLNDTPKMVALLLILPNFSSHPQYTYFLIGTMIAFGGLIDSRRVAETLGKKVTDMTPSQGFASNLVTAILVTTASFHSMPVSTTHVSVGSLLGMGVMTKQAKWRKVAEILMAWIVTLPCGAAFAAIAFHLLRLIAPASP